MSKVKDELCIEYGEFDVSQDRDTYIGGSDLPAICGISKFKSRWQCLLEKAGLSDGGFGGNKYTEYGHYIEPYIREHVNLTYNTNFVPCRVIEDDLRCHTDGFNGECVLEIKSTSDIHSTVDGYKSYLVQLVKYMDVCQVDKGILAVYDRPEDFGEFDPKRLAVYEITMEDYRGLLDYIDRELEKFRADRKRLEENPLLSEEDFLPIDASMMELATRVVKFELQLANLKEVEQQLKDAKKQLFNEMVRHGVKSWASPTGTKITRVDEVPASVKTVTEFDSEALKAENPALFQKYLRTVQKKSNGKAGFVRITLAKG